MNHSLKEIRNSINQYHTIAIAGHTNPDGDAIGSCLGLAEALQKCGKKVMVLLEAYGGKYDVIPGKSFVMNEGYDSLEPELFLSLDCGDKERLGLAETVFHKAKCTINIDHHKSNTYFAELNYVEEGASSTSELVYRLLNGYLPMNQSTAAALYAGIIYDTGGFRHSSTSPATMEAAGNLMSYSIPFTQIYNLFFDSKSFSELKIIGKAFDNAQLLFDGRFVYTTITKKEMDECGSNKSELDTIVNFLKGVNGTLASCFFYEKQENEIKASFRCGENFDVCAIAQKFGGGGHIKAAGCTIEASMEEAKKLVFAEIKERLK